MNYLFSPKNLTFYAQEYIGRYHEIPTDAVEISDEVFSVYSGIPPEGKILSSVNGMPAWSDAQPPTQEELTVENELIKNSLRVKADAEISWRQDAVDAGIATEEETAALAEWKKYRVLLMRVDTAKPVWPTPPGEQ
ncbi:TPA: tail fiber assembly protein [Citrobacter amalonaticus]